MSISEAPKESAGTLDDVTKALSRLGTLSYQQRKILKDGDVLSVLEQFVAAQKSSDWLHLGAVVVFGAKAVFGLLLGQFNWISGCISGVAALGYWKQRTTIREVTVIVRNYALAQGYQVPTKESLLMTELRLHHSLTYQQQQQMKAGEVVDVAKGVARSARRSGWMSLCGMSFCALLQLVTSLGSSGWSTWVDIIAGSGNFLMNGVFAIWMGRTNFVRARRLEELIGEHPAEMAALTSRLEVESDCDSPYRAPEFH